MGGESLSSCRLLSTLSSVRGGVTANEATKASATAENRAATTGVARTKGAALRLLSLHHVAPEEHRQVVGVLDQLSNRAHRSEYTPIGHQRQIAEATSVAARRPTDLFDHHRVRQVPPLLKLGPDLLVGHCGSRPRPASVGLQVSTGKGRCLPFAAMRVLRRA